jgi:hypothetical protein
MLHSRGSDSRWRTYYTVWTADDRCKVLREAMKLLGFERIRSRDCRHSHLASAIAWTCLLWTVLKYVGWLGAMSLICVATFAAASFAMRHAGQKRLREALR